MRHRWTRRFLPVLAIAGTTALLSLLLAGAAFDPNENPHASFRDAASCPRCHPVVGGRTDPDGLLPASAKVCLGCHSGEALGRSHPIGGRPRDNFPGMTVPGDYRLDDDGRMTCLTCHTAHGPFLATVKVHPGQKPENPDASPGTPLYYRTLYLRRTDPLKGWTVVCDGCHERL